MKSFKILIAATALVAVLLSACKEKEVFTGIDSTKAGITDFTYDETMSSSTSVSLTWNPDAALSAGATSFTVQLAHKEDFSDATVYEPSVSMYPDTPKGITIQKDASVVDGAIFSGLTEYDRFYARIRANYPRSIYSPWTILQDGGDLACISVGHGLMTMTFDAPRSIVLNSPAYSRIVASWSVVGKADGYIPEWKATSASDWTVMDATEKAMAEINGLQAVTSYDVRVRAYRDVEGTREYTDYVQGTVVTPEKPAFEPNIKDKDQVLMFISTIAATAGASDSYTLENDIDLEGAVIEAAAEAFAGAFDGKGHTLKNATFEAGLFTAMSGSFKNVKFSGVTLKNSLIGSTTEAAKISGISFDSSCKGEFLEPAEATNYGFVVGTNLGSVEDCSTAASTELKYAALPSKKSCSWGGIVGYTEGVVKNSHNTGKFALSVDAPASVSYHWFGGVVGQIKGLEGQAIVTGCSNKGAVSVEYGTAVYFCVGGVVGGSASAASGPGNYGIIENCTNEAAVSMHYIAGGSGAYPNIGGITGYTEGVVNGCTNKGDITILCDSQSATWTCARVAGVAGTCSRGASDCHNYGKLSATALFAGGTAGARQAGNIATTCIGGVIGSAGPYESDGTVKFEKCTNEVDLDLTLGTITETPNHHVGGVFGYVTGVIDDCHNKGNFTVTCPTAINRLGGIAGGCMYSVSNCTNVGKLKVVHAAITKTDWRHFVGGIVADAKTASKPTYTKCTNSGDLSIESTATVATSKTSAIGGIVGCGEAGSEITFTDCVNTGKMSYTSPGATVTGEMRGGDYN